MSNKSLQGIMESPEKRVSEATNVLARMFRLVCLDRDVNWPSLNTCIGIYLERQQKAVPRSNKEQTREKGNLVKELANDSLTWKNFVKGLQVLNPVSAELQLTLDWGRGRKSVHTVHMNVRNVNDANDTE